MKHIIRSLILLLALIGRVVMANTGAACCVDLFTTDTLLEIQLQTDKNDQPKTVFFDRASIAQLPKKTIHTSTLVTDGVKQFDGVLMRDLLDTLEIASSGTTVSAYALNDYVIHIPLRDFYEFDVVLATHMDGVQLTPADKGPLWIVYPRDSVEELQDIRYDYRWVWQLHRLIIR